jgi:membrane protein required for colicin V production
MDSILPTTAADIGIIVIIVLSAIFAYVRGFVRELFALAAWFGAAFVTIYWLDVVDDFFYSFISYKVVADILAASSLFLVSLIVFSMIAHMVSSWAQKSPLSSLDRFLGLIFGVIRGGLIVCIIYIFVVWFQRDKPMPQWIQEARYSAWVEKCSDWLMNLVPEKKRIEFLKMIQEELSEISDGEAPDEMTKDDNSLEPMAESTSEPSDETAPEMEAQTTPAESSTDASTNAHSEADAQYDESARKDLDSLVEEHQ